MEMESQLKRGLLEVCVLASIRKEDSYGYLIVKNVSQYIDISESTLYPILKRLENAGGLTSYAVEHKGRLRKYYSITQKGIKQIEKFLEDWVMVQRAYQFIAGEESHE